jgi:putative addiction module killer protein
MLNMYEIEKTEFFDRWFRALRDPMAKARIQSRLRNASLGNFGDTVPVGEGVFELRIHCGPGYRVYCKHRGKRLVVVLAGGDKSTQSKDIELAKSLAREL